MKRKAVLLHKTALSWGIIMEKCILCGLKSVINRQEGASRTIYNCQQCGVFVVSDLVEDDVKDKSDEIKSYLMTRKLAQKDADIVLISYEKSNLDKDYLRMTMDKISDFYPKTFSEQMEMALRNICYMSDFPGHEIRIFDAKTAPLFYVKDENPAALLYLMESLRNEKLIELKYYGGPSLPFGVTVAPKGWKWLEGLKKDELTQEAVFAYSSSGDEKISALFYGALEKAALECGYRFDANMNSRQDSRVTFGLVSGVKSSGLVVCDFTENSGGGYYAAAMAQSLGKPCILTCHESAAKKLQFDTSQFRLIIWDKQETLYLELMSTVKAML